MSITDILPVHVQATREEQLHNKRTVEPKRKRKRTFLKRLTRLALRTRGEAKHRKRESMVASTSGVQNHHSSRASDLEVAGLDCTSVVHRILFPSYSSSFLRMAGAYLETSAWNSWASFLDTGMIDLALSQSRLRPDGSSTEVMSVPMGSLVNVTSTSTPLNGGSEERLRLA